MTRIWFAGGDGGMRDVFGSICSKMGSDCIFFDNLVSSQKRLLSGECPAALFVFLERNIDGDLKLLETIRKRPLWQNLAILVVLSETGPEITALVRDIGVDGIIWTPLSAEQVDEELQRALKRRKIFSSRSQY
jgi:DNA-binding NarL/FixJ family response regulator